MPGCQHTQVHTLQRVSARLAAAAVLVGLAPLPTLAQGSLDFARQLYNAGRYEQAITAASRLRATPAVDGANLLLGRSYLERFRKSTDRADLVAAREALRDVRPSMLASRDREDFLVGLGEALYLDDSFGPAAELFRTALDHGQNLGPRAFERVFDWWATSLDRMAQSAAPEERDAIYASMRDRSRSELGRMPGSAAASYWLVVAYRYLGDLPHAWDSAIAGWMRAPLAEDQGRALRADLDQLVLQAIIPERVRLMAAADRDRERAATTLRAAWEGIKKDWPTRQQ